PSLGVWSATAPVATSIAWGRHRPTRPAASTLLTKNSRLLSPWKSRRTSDGPDLWTTIGGSPEPSSATLRTGTISRDAVGVSPGAACAGVTPARKRTHAGTAPKQNRDMGRA